MRDYVLLFDSLELELYVVRVPMLDRCSLTDEVLLFDKYV